MIKTYVAAIALSLLVAPTLVLAQTSQDDLRNAIQASVMSDPRVSDIPPAQLTGLIDALVSQAQAQKMTAADILWQPRTAEAADSVTNASGSVCPSGWWGYVCQVNRTFGFEGSSWDIPIILLVVSGLLIVVIWEIIAHHRKAKAAKMAVAPKAPLVR